MDRDAAFFKDGTAIVYIGGSISTGYQPDVTFYPYDIHTCAVWFVIMTPTYEIDIASRGNNYTTTPITDISTEHMIWKVRGFSVESGQMTGYAMIRFNITIERRSTFVMYTNVTPITVLTFSSLVVFCYLPTKESEFHFQ